MGKLYPIRVEPGLRRWRVRGFENFLIFYRPIDDGIEVLRVLHGQRDRETIRTLNQTAASDTVSLTGGAEPASGSNFTLTNLETPGSCMVTP